MGWKITVLRIDNEQVDFQELEPSEQDPNFYLQSEQHEWKPNGISGEPTYEVRINARCDETGKTNYIDAPGNWSETPLEPGQADGCRITVAYPGSGAYWSLKSGSFDDHQPIRAVLTEWGWLCDEEGIFYPHSERAKQAANPTPVESPMPPKSTPQKRKTSGFDVVITGWREGTHQISEAMEVLTALNRLGIRAALKDLPVAVVTQVDETAARAAAEMLHEAEAIVLVPGLDGLDFPIRNCPSCEEHISTFAESCPDCGCPRSAWAKLDGNIAKAAKERLSLLLQNQRKRQKEQKTSAAKATRQKEAAEITERMKQVHGMAAIVGRAVPATSSPPTDSESKAAYQELRPLYDAFVERSTKLRAGVAMLLGIVCLFIAGCPWYMEEATLLDWIPVNPDFSDCEVEFDSDEKNDDCSLDYELRPLRYVFSPLFILSALVFLRKGFHGLQRQKDVSKLIWKRNPPFAMVGKDFEQLTISTMMGTGLLILYAFPVELVLTIVGEWGDSWWFDPFLAGPWGILAFSVTVLAFMKDPIVNSFSVSFLTVFAGFTLGAWFILGPFFESEYVYPCTALENAESTLDDDWVEDYNYTCSGPVECNWEQSMRKLFQDELANLEGFCPSHLEESPADHLAFRCIAKAIEDAGGAGVEKLQPRWLSCRDQYPVLEELESEPDE